MEAVELTEIRAVLCGILLRYEDVIALPSPPRVSKQIDNVAFWGDAAPERASIDLTKVFADDDSAQIDLEYAVVANTRPNLVRTLIDPKGILHLDARSQLEPGSELRLAGVSQITVRPADPFHLTVDETFNVEVGTPSFDFIAVSPIESTEYGGHRDFVTLTPSSDSIILDNVAFAHDFDRDEVVAPCVSANLLTSNAPHIIEPGTEQRFATEIAAEARIRLDTAELPSEELVGFRDTRRRLEVNVPTLEEAAFVFVLVARAATQNRAPYELCSDRILVVDADLTQQSPEGDYEISLAPTGARELTREQFAERLLRSFMRSYGETAAYERARLCTAVPFELDIFAVSDFCYYGDSHSPFRREGLGSASSLGTPWLRSNAIETIRVVREREPDLSDLIFGPLVASGSTGSRVDHIRSSLARAQAQLRVVTSQTIDSRTP